MLGSEKAQELDNKYDGEMTGVPMHRLGCGNFCCCFLASALLFVTGAALSQQAEEASAIGIRSTTMTFVNTSSPQNTLRSYKFLMDQSQQALLKYVQDKSAENFAKIDVYSGPLFELIEMSDIPSAARRKIARETMFSLADIFSRIELPPLEKVPSADTSGLDELPAFWRIPKTPIKIARIDHGPREGEFLFTERTTRIAPRFAARIENEPLLTQGGVERWRDIQVALTGPMIPRGFELAIPPGFKALWLETPVWKIFASILSMILTGLLLLGLHRVMAKVSWVHDLSKLFRELISAVSILATIYALDWFVVKQLRLIGNAAQFWDVSAIVAMYAASVWIFWLLILALFEIIILSPSVPKESLDANLLRLLGHIIGIIGSVFIIAYGAQEVGLPLFSVLAGLGVGGLAVALALRPTMENLIGGVILYLDKPVRVGDYCSYGEHMGMVEAIGVRTTQVRALDRTLVSIPNAQFADQEIINWARCDKMLADTKIGLRYETTPDQMRFVLISLREMLIAHPMVETETVRVRMTEFADFSKNISIRIFILTNDLNEFFAVREDVLLRVDEIVTQSGVGFAFPSTTLYLGRDVVPDKESAEMSEHKIAHWRQRGELPFPTFAADRISALDGTLEYPPRGGSNTTVTSGEAAEPLGKPESDNMAESEEKKKSS